MSKRPIEQKKRNRIAKQLRNTPTTQIDLIDYIRLRTRCTRGTAEKVLLMGALTVDGKELGYSIEKRIDGAEYKRLRRYLPAEYRNQIRVRDYDKKPA